MEGHALVKIMPENPEYEKEFMLEKIAKMIEEIGEHLASDEPKTEKVIAYNNEAIETMELLLEEINAFPNSELEWEDIEEQFHDYLRMFEDY